MEPKLRPGLLGGGEPGQLQLPRAWLVSELRSRAVVCSLHWMNYDWRQAAGCSGAAIRSFEAIRVSADQQCRHSALTVISGPPATELAAR